MSEHATVPSESSDSTSSDLLSRVKASDADAWSRLVKLYGPVVYRWSRASGLQATDAADIVQETFRAVAAHIEDFRRDGPADTFRGWLWTIARNKIRDHFRRLAEQPQAAGGDTAHALLAQLADADPDESDDVARRSAQASLARRAIALMQGDFEETSWRAFWLTAVEGLPAGQAAAELGLSAAAVYMAKSRVLRRLRQELGGLDVFDADGSSERGASAP
jgi:RNA polymerase sigma-70 factor (ECF subfamily)